MDFKNGCSLLTFSFLGGGLLGISLGGWFGFRTCPEIKAVVGVSNALDFILSSKLSNQTASDWSVHLELFAEDSASDAEDLGGLSEDFVVFLLLEEDIVVKFVINLDLSPLFRCLLRTSGLGSLSTLGGSSSLFFWTLLLLFRLHKHSKLVTDSNRQWPDSNLCKMHTTQHKTSHEWYLCTSHLIQQILSSSP